MDSNVIYQLRAIGRDGVPFRACSERVFIDKAVAQAYMEEFRNKCKNANLLNPCVDPSNLVIAPFPLLLQGSPASDKVYQLIAEGPSQGGIAPIDPSICRGSTFVIVSTTLFPSEAVAYASKNEWWDAVRRFDPDFARIDAEVVSFSVRALELQYNRTSR
jgi:hypothetical protein